MKYISICGAAVAIGFTFSGFAEAALIDRGNGLVYDEHFNITWLADANYPKTTNFSIDGRLNWFEANVWASQLEYMGYSDWRLPFSDSCSGANCSEGELGHLYYSDFAVSHPQSVLASTADSFQFFSNVQDADYWSARSYMLHPDEAWFFSFSVGNQNVADKLLNAHFALAVRDGDVFTIDEPAESYLVASGLLVLAALKKPRNRRVSNSLRLPTV